MNKGMPGILTVGIVGLGLWLWSKRAKPIPIPPYIPPYIPDEPPEPGEPIPSVPVLPTPSKLIQYQMKYGGKGAIIIPSSARSPTGAFLPEKYEVVAILQKEIIDKGYMLSTPDLGLINLRAGLWSFGQWVFFREGITTTYVGLNDILTMTGLYEGRSWKSYAEEVGLTPEDVLSRVF